MGKDVYEQCTNMYMHTSMNMFAALYINIVCSNSVPCSFTDHLSEIKGSKGGGRPSGTSICGLSLQESAVTTAEAICQQVPALLYTDHHLQIRSV
jgi:hypothetical protein